MDIEPAVRSVLHNYADSLAHELADLCEDEEQRDKFTIFVSDGIKPKLEASRYMDREDNENELKQVLGDTDAAYNLSPDDVLIVGRSGVLISGPGSRKHEDILLTYLSDKRMSPGVCIV